MKPKSINCSILYLEISQSFKKIMCSRNSTEEKCITEVILICKGINSYCRNTSKKNKCFIKRMQ